MKKFNFMKSKLDEMQEKKLAEIESSAYWIAFWGLFAAIMIQNFMGNVKDALGELIVFLVLALYVAVRCIRNGIWDRRLQANRRTNLIISLIGGAFVFAFNMLLTMKWHNTAVMLISSVITAVLTFIICFAFLSISMAAYKKIKNKLEDEEDEAEEQ